MRYLITFLFIINIVNAQFDVPLTLYKQFNGKYGYTIIGNTHNTIDNWDPSIPPCLMLTQSSATLNLLPTQNIVGAFLYLNGCSDGALASSALFNNVPVTPELSFVCDINPPLSSTPYFSTVKDVTTMVQVQGNGVYSITNLNLNPVIFNYCSNAIYYSGWTLIIVYGESTLPNTQLNLYHGLRYFGYQNIIAINVPINNLNVINAQNAKISYVVHNGSTNLFDNESILFNNNVLSNALNSANNPFNSTNSFTSSTTNWNQDIDTFDISSYLSVGDTQANIAMSSDHIRVVSNIITSIRSELTDATVQITQVTGQQICNNRDLAVNYTVSNINSNAVLPADVPVSFYANNVLLQTVNTPSSVAIGGSLALTTTVSIPVSVPNTFTLKVVVDNNAANVSTVAESNENNNEFSQSVTFVGNTVNPTFAIANTFCQGASIPALPLTSTNNISGTWLPNVISNQNSGNYVFTPNAGQCNLPLTLNVTVSPNVNPTFTIANTFCQSATVPTLPLISTNNISGTWLPTAISNQNSGSYVFTPDVGSCGLLFALNVTISPNVNPTFTIANTFCQGAIVPTLPLISNNNISGTWLPNVISNQNSGSYVFTPNAGQCGLPFTLNVTISPNVNPTFTIANNFCQGATVPTLPLFSNNNISGIWSPTAISNQNSGSYIFTPNAVSCGLPFTLNVTVSPNVNPTFTIANSFCQGANVPTLPLISTNNISGTWLPTIISNQSSGSYVFTPNAGSCGLPFTLNVVVSPNLNPTFTLANSFCQGAIVPALPLISTNNISGTWTPSIISNQNSGSYVFTPNAGSCGLPFTLNVVVSPNVNPTFAIANTFCQGASVPILPLVSDNAITGTWFPTAISSQNSGSYVFTPNIGSCGLPFTLNVTVSPNVNPTFTITNTFCQGATVPTLPLNSTNNITGTWLPNVISNQNNGSYIFTPNTGSCGLPFTLNVTVSPNVNPTFTLANTFCQGAIVPALPLISTNNISGTWLPSIISNQNSGSYVFTPNADQCWLPFTLNVTVSPNVNPTFTIANSFCQGASVPTLPLISINNISGTWSPNVISNQNSGSYIFTPNAVSCGLPFTLNVTVSPNVNPTFTIANTFCQGAIIPTLPLLSNNNISGTWLPNVISNQSSGSYVFTPNTGSCGLPFTLNVTVSPNVNPTFAIANTFCQGTIVPALPLISANNISGTWLPSAISSQNSGSYVFTPNTGSCGLPFTLNVTVSPNLNPTFTIANTFC